MLVVSRGDEQMVRLEGHSGWHFPRHEDGRFAGYHPENSEEAIAHLEELRAKGAEYLVFPETALWWLDFYGDFRDHLETRYRIQGENESCLIYDVSLDPELDLESDGDSRAEGARLSTTPVGGVVDWLLPSGAKIALLSGGGSGLAGLDPERTVSFQPASDDASAVSHLDRLLEQGVEFLVIPSSAFAWFEMHPALRQHLSEHHRFVTRQRHVCEIYELTADA